MNGGDGGLSPWNIAMFHARTAQQMMNFKWIVFFKMFSFFSMCCPLSNIHTHNLQFQGEYCALTVKMTTQISEPICVYYSRFCNSLINDLKINIAGSSHCINWYLIEIAFLVKNHWTQMESVLNNCSVPCKI